MVISSELQKFFDNKEQRSDIENYLDDLNVKFGLDKDYRLKIEKILSKEPIDVVTDPRVEKAIIDGNNGLQKLESKKSLKFNYALNYSSNPYFSDDAANDQNYLIKKAA